MIVASARLPKLITQYAPLRAALSLAYAVPRERPVVIRGERGTGKTLLSQTLRLSAPTRTILELTDGGAPDRDSEWVLIDLPPLRERAVDIPLLATHFAGSSAILSRDAIDCLESHIWPGNVAELRDVVKRAASRCPLISPYYIVCGFW